MIIVRAHYKCY